LTQRTERFVCAGSAPLQRHCAYGVIASHRLELKSALAPTREMNYHLALLLTFAAAFISGFPSANAAPIALDFGGTGQDVQSGYIGVSGTGSGFLGSPVFQVPGTALPGGETLTITSSSSLSFRDRGNFSSANYGPLVNLFEDYIRAGTATAANGNYSTMTIDVGGLLANTEYQLTLRLYDGGISATTVGAYAFTITGTGDTNLGNNNYAINFHNGGPGLPADSQAGYSESFISNASGNLQIVVTQTAGLESSIPMNSFDLVNVPEPTSALLIATGAFLTVMHRRRRNCWVVAYSRADTFNVLPRRVREGCS
jgi:hypothetical protein